MSFFVCFLYASMAAVKIVSKFVEDVPAVGGTWDIVLVEDARLDAYIGDNKKVTTRVKGKRSLIRTSLSRKIRRGRLVSCLVYGS